MTRHILTITFLAIGLLSVLLLSCRKETDSLLEVVADRFGGDDKLQLDGKYSVWESGDLIRLNGTTAEVVRNSNGHAYIAASAADDVNMAVFPSTLCNTLAGETVTVSLPHDYTYRTADGLQVLPMPMAAVSAGSSPLHFRHLTGALMLKISGPLVLESVTVSSDKYQLSGNRTLNFGDIGSQAPIVAANALDRQVTMHFDGTAIDGTLDVILPLAPVGADNVFTVSINARRRGTRYNYRRTQASGGSLGQNVIAYAAIDDIMGGSHTDSTYLFPGTGTLQSPFQIATPADFLLMVEAFNNQWKVYNHAEQTYDAVNYILTDSLDMQNAAITSMAHYSGSLVFDGNSFTIKNLIIDSWTIANIARCGLFSNVSGAVTLKDLTLRNITLRHNGNTAIPLYLSPMCAEGAGCTITNCTVDGVTLDITGTTGQIVYGNLLGLTGSGTSTLTSCTATGSFTLLHPVSKAFYYGSIVGRVENASTTLTIASCTASAHSLSVTNSNSLTLGGIVGYISSSTVTLDNDLWAGDMTLTSSNNAVTAGGMVGRYIYGSGSGIFLTVNNNCSATGSITANGTGSSYMGAYVGMANNPSHISIPGTIPDGLVMTLNGNAVTKTIGNQ